MVCVQYVSMSLAILPVNRTEVVRITFYILSGFVVFVLFFYLARQNTASKRFAGFQALACCVYALSIMPSTTYPGTVCRSRTSSHRGLEIMPGRQSVFED